MVLQVYNAEKPAYPRRALIGAALLLTAACALAASMTYQRASNVLGPRLSPADWPISFQPPRLFEGPERGVTPLGPTYVFGGPTRGGDHALLIVYRLSKSLTKDSSDAGRLVLGSPLWQVHTAEELARLPAQHRTLGPLDAIDLSDPARSVAIRAARIDTGEAYVFALRVGTGRLDARTARLFDQICDSVELRSP